MEAMQSPSSAPTGRCPCHEEFPRGESVGGGFADCDGRQNRNFGARDVIHRRRRRHADEVTAGRRCRASPDSDGCYRSRCRRRRSPAWSSGSLVVVAIAAITIAKSIIVSEAFSALPTPMVPCLKTSSSALNAVHKRAGNRDLSSPSAAAISASRTQTTKKVSAAKRKKASATVAAATTAPTMDAPATATPIRRRTGRKSNVFEQFTPEYMASPYDVDLSPQNGETETTSPKQKKKNGAVKKTTRKHAKRVNRSQINKSNRMNLRLRSLLRDDTGEQETEMFPDDSLEAAEQLADLKSYNKLSEEARRKANLAVSADGDDEDEGGESGTVVDKTTRAARPTAKRGKIDEAEEEATANAVTLASSNVVKPARTQRRRVRATVKETGSDSISTYIKSLGQHELLYKEDEVLLGRQVRMLTALEERRGELEVELLRPPTFAQWAEATNHTVPSLKQQIRRSQRAKAALIEANLRLVITVARQAVKKSPLRRSQSANSVQFQDACQQGIIGLTRATEKFDPELGFRFSTYAVWWIQKEVARNVSEQSRSVRVPQNAIKRINDIRIQERVLMNELGHRPSDEELAERVGMSVGKLEFYRRSAREVGSLDKKIDARTGKGSMSTGGDNGDGATMDVFVRDTEHPSPSELVDQQMLKEDIRRLVKTLSPREQAVIRLRFGLDDGKPLGLADIGAKFGVEKARIRKIEARALLKLRQPGRSQVVRCYVSDHA